jgi:transposase-like protein
MVSPDAGAVERDLAEGRLHCPQCKSRLAPWGWARRRAVRRRGAERPVRPRRTRCRSCRATHVLLPVRCLLRRRDDVEAVGAALTAKASGQGRRRIGRRLEVPDTTVRGWLHRFAERAELIRAHFSALAVGLEPSSRPAGPAGGAFADALEAIGAAALAAARRLGPAPVWWFCSGATGGLLLANTGSPFPPLR